jgi:3-oxoacyl-[acyl-carrier protein] reductase
MNIIITGASRGIGFELARYFAAKGPHTILAVSRNESKLMDLQQICEQSGAQGKIIPVPLDIDTIELEHERLTDAIQIHCKSVDILVNNAGMLIHKAFGETSLAEARAMFNVNVFAPAALIRVCLPYMGKMSRSHVINIGSMGGVQGSVKFPGLAYYSSAKAALATLTECLAEEYRTGNISFNCLALGSVQTAMLEEAFPGYKATFTAFQVAGFIGDFCLNGVSLFNGKIIPVAATVP